MGMCRFLVLLAWTIAVSAMIYDSAVDRWVVGYEIADEAGATVATGSMEVPGTATPADIRLRLQEILRAARQIRTRPPVAPGFKVVEP